MSVRLVSKAVHSMCRAGTYPGYKKFVTALHDVENTQRNVLKGLLKLAERSDFGKAHSLDSGLSYEAFAGMLPVTDYSDWRALIKKQREEGGTVISGQKCNRYQPTSGSTSKMKRIPYTPKLLKEFDNCISPWIYDLYKTVKGIRHGKHYWSLSWVPTDLRLEMDDNVSDDMKLMPAWKRFIGSLTMAVPNEVSSTLTSESSIFATSTYLASVKDLTFLSMWSPTFAINQLQYLADNRHEIARVLETGHWGRRSAELVSVKCPSSKRAAAILKAWDGTLSPGFFEILWPNLSLISSWATSTSSIWATELKEKFNDVRFQGKSLWATEGVVTIPFQGKYPLAVTSHFYEFEDLETGEILPSWQLTKGQNLSPLLSTGSGFFRYRLSDRVKVVDYIGECPCFEFMGRMDGVDMIGEKMNPEIAQNIINSVSEKGHVTPLTLFAIQNHSGKPYYLLLCQGESSPAFQKLMGEYVDNMLREYFHYNLGRDLGQLDTAKCLITLNAKTISEFRGKEMGMIMGDMKVEPLTLWTCDLHEDILKLQQYDAA